MFSDDVCRLKGLTAEHRLEKNASVVDEASMQIQDYISGNRSQPPDDKLLAAYIQGSRACCVCVCLFGWLGERPVIGPF